MTKRSVGVLRVVLAPRSLALWSSLRTACSLQGAPVLSRTQHDAISHSAQNDAIRPLFLVIYKH